MKTRLLAIFAGAIIFSASAYAQSPDSFMVSNDTAPPGGTATVSIYLRNTQFSVSGFSTRFVFRDSVAMWFADVERGADVADFEHFDFSISDGTCRIIGVADLPGGGSPAPLPIGLHELAVVQISVAEDAPWGYLDSIFFAEDLLPPGYDNSISDSTGYILEEPTLTPGWILTDIFIGTEDSPGTLPREIGLLQNYPNPFNIKTTISFELPSVAGDVSLKIYDLVGRLVRGYEFNALGPGMHRVVWDGADISGRPVSTGLYFYRLEVDSSPAMTMKMTLLK